MIAEVECQWYCWIFQALFVIVLLWIVITALVGISQVPRKIMKANAKEQADAMFERQRQEDEMSGFVYGAEPFIEGKYKRR